MLVGVVIVLEVRSIGFKYRLAAGVLGVGDAVPDTPASALVICSRVCRLASSPLSELTGPYGDDAGLLDAPNSFFMAVSSPWSAMRNGPWVS